MKIAILAPDATHIFESKQLVDVCKERGIGYEYYNIAQYKCKFDADHFKFLDHLLSFDYIVPRLTTLVTCQFLYMLFDYSPAFIKKVFDGEYIYRSGLRISKVQQYNILAQHGFKMPETWYCGSLVVPPPNWDYPFILKRIHGARGEFVHLVHSKAELDTLKEGYGHGYTVLQKTLPMGEDYRVIVLGGEVVGSLKKFARPGDFRTNVTVNGMPEGEAGFVGPVEPERKAEIEDVARRATLAIGTQFSGVDVMYDADNVPNILEVNASPGYATPNGFWKATGINVSERIINYLQSLA